MSQNAGSPPETNNHDDSQTETRGFIYDLYDEIGNSSSVHQRLVRLYQKHHHRKLVVYSALFSHPGGIIGNEDSETIENVLRSCDMSQYKGLDLMIHSPGGMPQAAGDIIRVCRAYSESFRTIIPNMAMSAATVLGMGSDEIIMSDTSKLGPIDPQMIFQTKEGTLVRAAKSIIDAFGALVTEANNLAAQNKPATAQLHLLTKQDPSWIVECFRARKATVDLAIRVLKTGMLKTKSDDEIQKVAGSFLDIGDTTSHGRTISSKEAAEMGLKITHEDKFSNYWKLTWEIYVRTELYTRNKGLTKYICTDTGAIEMQVRQIALGGS